MLGRVVFGAGGGGRTDSNGGGAVRTGKTDSTRAAGFADSTGGFDFGFLCSRKRASTFFRTWVADTEMVPRPLTLAVHCLGAAESSSTCRLPPNETSAPRMASASHASVASGLCLPPRTPFGVAPLERTTSSRSGCSKDQRSCSRAFIDGA
jgi:hypothetical protein